MTRDAILVTLVAALCSGVVGVGISAWFFARLERRKLKMDTARRLIGHRFDITGSDFSVAMNEVFIVFADSPQVISAMTALYEALSAPGKPNADDRLVTLLKEICRDLRITHGEINDAYFLKTFNAR